MNKTYRIPRNAPLLATCLLSAATASGQNDHLIVSDGAYRTQAGLRYAHDLDAAGVSLPPVVADFTGDHRPDLLSVLGVQPYLSIGVGSMNLESDLPLPDNSFAVSALGKVEFGSIDLPMMLGSLDDTLAIWTIDQSTGLCDVHVPEGGEYWASAMALRSADVDGVEGQELIGMFSAGASSTVIQIGEWFGDPADPSSLSISVSETLTLGAPLTLLETVDLSSISPGEEIVFTYDDRIGILNESLAFVDFRFLVDPIVCATPINDAGGPGLAVVTRDGANGDSVRVLRPSMTEDPTPVGVCQTRAMAATDNLVHGQEDLVLLGDYVVLLENAHGSGVSTYRLPQVYSNLNAYGASVDQSSTWIVADDLDNDGDGDLAWFWQASPLHPQPRLLVTFNSLVHEGFESVSFDTDLFRFEDPLALLEPTIQMPVGIETEQFDDGRTHIQTVLMLEDGIDELESFTSLTAIAADENGLSVAELAFTNTDASLYDRYQIYMRPVQVDPGSDEIISVGPDLRIDFYLNYAHAQGWTFDVKHGGGIPGNGLPGPGDPGGSNNGPPPAGTGSSS